MNKQLTKIKELDKQIDFLRNELKSKSFLGSGITLDISIGAKGGRHLNDLQVSVFSGNEDALINLLLDSVVKSRGYYLKVANEELNELTNYLR